MTDVLTRPTGTTAMLLSIHSNRDIDDLKRQLRDTESEVKAQDRRCEATISAQRRELGAALAEADDARSLANELRDSLQARNKERRLDSMIA